MLAFRNGEDIGLYSDLTDAQYAIERFCLGIEQNKVGYKPVYA